MHKDLLLCDIGNTTYHFLEEGCDRRYKVKEFNPTNVTQTVYYISVNPTCKEVLEGLDNWIDIKAYIDYSLYYESMGVDRAVVCEYISEGVIVDVGSAITVDVKRDNIFEGGFIYPGVNAMQKAYVDISTKLDYELSFELTLDKMPKNSRDAISYGFLAPLIKEIESYNLPIIITGGDGEKFCKFFKHATYDKLLIFKAMKKIIQEGNVC